MKKYTIVAIFAITALIAGQAVATEYPESTATRRRTTRRGPVKRASARVRAALTRNKIVLDSQPAHVVHITMPKHGGQRERNKKVNKTLQENGYNPRNFIILGELEAGAPCPGEGIFEKMAKRAAAKRAMGKKSSVTTGPLMPAAESSEGHVCVIVQLKKNAPKTHRRANFHTQMSRGTTYTPLPGFVGWVKLDRKYERQLPKVATTAGKPLAGAPKPTIGLYKNEPMRAAGKPLLRSTKAKTTSLTGSLESDVDEGLNKFDVMF